MLILMIVAEWSFDMRWNRTKFTDTDNSRAV